LFTIKMGWSETNRFPHTRFWWEGIDGSRVLVQQMNTPEDTYNGQCDASTLLRIWRNHTDKQIAREALQPVGFGDGGGGPTEDMIENLDLLRDFPAIPSVRFTSVHAYFLNALTEADQYEPPTWFGELYLEYHRGTLSTQGRTKFLHRRAERDLIAAEALASLVLLAGGAQPPSLEEQWRLLMINQFHDILPGSSIRPVYERTERELGEIIGFADSVSNEALDRLAAQTGESKGGQGLLVFNPDLSPRALRLSSSRMLPGGQRTAEGSVLCSDELVPGLSTFRGVPRSPSIPATATSQSLENRFLKVEFAGNGTIARIFDKQARREVLSGRGNQIWIYRDQPREYDAWDIDEDYRRVGEESSCSSPLEIAEEGPHRAALKVVRRYRDSSIVQWVRLWANSPRLEFHTHFDWHDRRLLVRALFPVLIRSDSATFECAFGTQKRPTHANTSWDAARFEVAAHRFVDLSEQGYGVALLNDGRYGHSVRKAELGVTLLRSPTLPDRFADEGEQSVTYALLPHTGGWHEAGVLAEAEDLNRPLFHRPIPGCESATRPLLKVHGLQCGFGALKPAEDGCGLIFRVYEPAGGRGRVAIEPPEGWQVAGETNLLEDEIPASAEIGPFEIKSFRLTPRAGS
ncbi:MAG: alpha-mannosidase, partial [Alphaproteobacteria bacterium]|nr:alpha-mannosidase [Alphaproteobacteria bacterium]